MFLVRLQQAGKGRRVLGQQGCILRLVQQQVQVSVRPQSHRSLSVLTPPLGVVKVRSRLQGYGSWFVPLPLQVRERPQLRNRFSGRVQRPLQGQGHLLPPPYISRPVQHLEQAQGNPPSLRSRSGSAPPQHQVQAAKYVSGFPSGSAPLPLQVLAASQPPNSNSYCSSHPLVM